ncbi:hypothetical protein TNCV_3428491 [Trichonephila clavipes]|nr:hypothetical protein TNCV_3428491 [Trichonephila clavipes]
MISKQSAYLHNALKNSMLLCTRNWNQVLIPPSSIWCCHWPGDAAFVQGTGINFLIPPSSVWCCHWPCVATWWMLVGGVRMQGPMGWKWADLENRAYQWNGCWE